MSENVSLDNNCINSAFIGKNGVLLIAEIGGNHEGDFEYACHLTELACNAGADVVKFQVYTGESLVSIVEAPVRAKHFNRFALNQDQYIQLADLCIKNGVRFNASVWDVNAFSYLDEYLDFYKIGSGDLTAYPILKDIAARGKPIIMSTGLSTLDEVVDAVNFLVACNPVYKRHDMLSLLQCTSMYPIPDNEANISVMSKLKSELGYCVGYSDHTVGVTALEVAVAAGAQVLEFHFTDEREGKEFRDHQVSLMPKELSELSKKIIKIKELLGDGQKSPTPSEIENDHIRTFRRSVYLATDLKAGDEISEDKLVSLRPNNGIDARMFENILGKKLAKDIRAFEAFNEDDLL